MYKYVYIEREGEFVNVHLARPRYGPRVRELLRDVHGERLP